MWQMNTEIVPVVVAALGVIKKGSEKLVREIPGNINLYRIFKRQHYWERHKCYGRSYPSSDNNDKETLKCPRLLEKKNSLKN